MVVQLLLGSALICLTALVAALAWWALELFLLRTKAWGASAPVGLRLTVILACAMIWTILMLLAAVWIWAVTLWQLEIFITFEAAMYFALVAFTTLGFGDILLPIEWRLLGGLAAANGLLIFGLLTAMLVETLRQIRLRQMSH